MIQLLNCPKAVAIIAVMTICGSAPASVHADDWNATVKFGGAADVSAEDRRRVRSETKAIVTGSTRAPAGAASTERTGATATAAAESNRPADRSPSDARVPARADDKSLAAACSLLIDEATKTALDAERRSIQDTIAEMVRQSDLLERRTQVFKEWVQKRDLLVRQISKLVVDTYAKMKPESAALQLAAMELGQAGAILSRLEPEKVSAIVSEMDAARAAAILSALSGAVATDAEPPRGR